jgi:site-specific DNA-cytosine methylase
MTGLTATVLFAGAGLESEALRQLGIQVDEAINHDPLTVATHDLNHPNTHAECADITAIKPGRRHRTDILAASPVCTDFTRANGRPPESDLYATDLYGRPPGGKDQRALMWDVLKFMEAACAHRRPYRLVFVENVPEIADWVLWSTWRMGVRALGYQMVVVSRSSAFETGQDRPRIYVLAVPVGTPPPDVSFTPPAPCGRCGEVEAVQVWRRHGVTAGRWGEQYDYRCPHCRGQVAPYAVTAAEVLDVDRPGRPIGRLSRLVPASVERVERALAAWGPAGARTHARFTPRPGVARPDALTVSYYGDDGEKGWPILAPARTLTGTARHALVTWPGPGAELGDCGYRMFTVAEQRRLQGVPAHYRFAGTSRDHIRMIGNGVPIPTVRNIIRPALESILGERTT